MDDDPHRQSLAVDQGVDFAALDLLTGVVTDLVVSTAPFSADLTDWLSRTAAEGLASRLIRSRKFICSSAQIAFQTPSRWNLRKMLCRRQFVYRFTVTKNFATCGSTRSLWKKVSAWPRPGKEKKVTFGITAAHSLFSS